MFIRKTLLGSAAVALFIGVAAQAQEMRQAPPAMGLPTLMTGVTDPARNLTLAELNDIRQIELVMETYVRGVDMKDGKLVSDLFTPDAIAEIIWNDNGTMRSMGEPLRGSGAIDWATRQGKRVRGWSHHFLSNPLIDVRGDSATLNVQFVVFKSVSAPVPEGSPAGTFAMIATDQEGSGSLKPGIAGYYQSDFKKINGQWKIVYHRILHDRPYTSLIGVPVGKP